MAAFPQQIQGTSYAGRLSREAICDLEAGACGRDEGGYPAEFQRLLSVAA